MSDKIKLLCPHCEREFVLQAAVRVDTIMKSELDTEDSRIATWRSRLSENEIHLVEQAGSLGLIKALHEALERSNGPVPRNMEKFFLDWNKSTTPMVIPRSSLYELIAEFGGQITVCQYQNIGAVYSDGQLRMFAPISYLGPSKTLSKSGPKDSSLDYTQLTREWIRTRMGYVPIEAKEFATELGRRRVGDFARAMSGRG